MQLVHSLAQRIDRRGHLSEHLATRQLRLNFLQGEIVGNGQGSFITRFAGLGMTCLLLRPSSDANACLTGDASLAFFFGDKSPILKNLTICGWAPSATGVAARMAALKDAPRPSR
jgi:hypothetical protein